MPGLSGESAAAETQAAVVIGILIAYFRRATKTLCF
jgi:hypothetical protein